MAGDCSVLGTGKPIYNQIFRRLIELAESGVQIFYTPGNHDEFLRHFLRDFGLLHVADEFVHCGPAGRRYLVTHGDKFDAVETKARWLSLLGASGYDALVWLNQWINRRRRRWGLAPWAMSTAVKGRVKQAVKFVSDFEQVLMQHARDQQCDGVICGHIHTPVLEQRDDILYCNTGDWVENSTAVVEHWDGQLQLLYARDAFDKDRKLPLTNDASLLDSRSSRQRDLPATVAVH